MNVHLHQARHIMGWILGIAFFSPFVLCIESPEEPVTFPEVTGRIKFAGRPINDMILCLDSDKGDHSAFSILNTDGSFRLLSMVRSGIGTPPGRYRGHLSALYEGPTIPAKYLDPRSLSLEIEIASGWNDLDINLD